MEDQEVWAHLRCAALMAAKGTTARDLAGAAGMAVKAILRVYQAGGGEAIRRVLRDAAGTIEARYLTRPSNSHP